MPLSTQIKAIVDALPGNHSYLYGTAKEINVKADNVTAFPVFCHYPFSTVGVKLGATAANTNEFNIYIEILFKTKFEKDTLDNEPLINSAIAYANKFLFELSNYREPGSNNKFFKWDYDVLVTLTPTYNKLDVNTCGVGFTFKPKLMNTPSLLDC